MMTMNDVALTGGEIEAMLHTGKLDINQAYKYAAARATLAWAGLDEEAPASLRPTQIEATVRPGR